MNDAHSLTAALLQTGNRLWSAVKCDVTGDCVIVYARLCMHPQGDVHDALAESERVFVDVLGGRLDEKKWLATVYWGDRSSKTFTP
jgi:hypothetical protein